MAKGSRGATAASAADLAPRVGIYGVMNAGKSSLLNRLTGQQAAVVSPLPGTTTDPVRRSFEIVGFGPVVFIDTAGIDDTATELGLLRVRKTLGTLPDVDLAVVVLLGISPSAEESALLDSIRANDVPYLLVPERGADLAVEDVLGRIAAALSASAGFASPVPPFFGDRNIAAGEVVVLVCPMDGAAPAGRLILPQVQALRAALDAGAVAVTVQPAQLAGALRLRVPRLVVTDSQVFGEVTAVVGEVCPGVEVTSFSVLLAEQKGDKEVYSEGLLAVDSLKTGDRVLIIENCSHQVTCEDIGRSKIPSWLREYTGLADLSFVFVSGRDVLPAELYTVPGFFALAVQCGGCVATRRMVQSRILACRKNGVPVTNYGMLIRKLRVGG